MTRFIVEIPESWRIEREYALSVLLGDWLGLEYEVRVHQGLRDTTLSIDGSSDATITIPEGLFSQRADWLTPASLPATPLPTATPPEWCTARDSMPLLYAAHGTCDALIHTEGTRTVLCWDLVGSLFLLLTRYEEYIESADRDALGRFRGSASILARSGWLRSPVLDMYVSAFADVLERVWPGSGVHIDRTARLVLSHDVDHPGARLRWRGRERLRIVAADLVRRRDLDLGLRRARSFLMPVGGGSPDPYDTFDYLMGLSEAQGQRDTFFFLTEDTHLPDGSRFTVDDPWARRLIKQIGARGHFVGLHGSYLSYDDPVRLAREWARLESVTMQVAPHALRRAIRQHYLRWTPGITWRAQAQAGLTMDESLGFADLVGFRAGTARTFEAFDVAASERLGLRVRPLHIMDVTLLQHMAVSRDDALGTAAEMWNLCRRYGGGFSVLWHNSSLETRQAKDLYESMIRGMSA